MEHWDNLRQVIVGYNASGAAWAAQRGFVVMIVDVIDMSTSLETALDEGASYVLGASPDLVQAPVLVNPFMMGFLAGKKALELKTQVILIAEPRLGEDNLRLQNSNQVIQGLEQAGATLEAILPNLGAEIARGADFRHKVVLCVSATGGVAFDAAYQWHEKVTIGTIARTSRMKGRQPAYQAVQRAIDLAEGASIAVIAASSNSLEDVIAANFLSQLILDSGYADLKN